MSQPGRMEVLGAALRAAATNAAGLTEGGSALLFASAPGDANPDAKATLRAAAGFESPDAARKAADGLTESVRESLGKRPPSSLDELVPLVESAEGGLSAVPLGFEDRVRGVLVVGPADRIQGDVAQALCELVNGIGLRIDHAHLRAELDSVASESGVTEGDGHSDELLKLSEQLFAQDIELLQNNEKLGKIEKLKNDFIEKMSRELRTPLNSIIEAIISVIAGESGQLSEASVTSLRGALDEGTAFQRTLQNILDLWRIKQNEMPVGTQEVNFPEVVEEAIFSVQETLGDKPVEIEKEFEQPFPKIRTDLAKINQLLFLLLDNAVKFTNEGSITITARTSENQLVCEIRDTGIGICPDDQQLVFDEFFQVDDAESNTYRGAGLGLALVRDLLVLIEGDISLSSEAGKGSCVTFRVPVEIC